MSTQEDKNKGKDMSKRSNVCFNCGGLVPQVGPAQTVIVAICENGCRYKYMKAFTERINMGMDWREARLSVLQLIVEDGGL